MKSFRIILFFLSAFCFFTAWAENVTISGKVVDSDDKPIEFGTVQIKNTSVGTNTNLEGVYSLSVAAKDTLDVVFSCIGYKTVNQRLIKPKGTVTLNVRLLTDSQILDEVQVEGFRSNINGMQSFDTDAFKLSPDVSGGSVESILATMPGVNSNNEMSSQYSVRGGTFDENSVYINGVEIYRPQLMKSGQQEGLSIINPDLVGNIKFSSGGFPARYADKMSSVLDIAYRDPQAFELKANASLMGGAFALGTNSGKFSMIHGIRFKKNNSLLSSLDTRGEYDPSYFDYQTNLTFKSSDKFSINFLGNIALNNYNFKPSDRETTFGTSENAKSFRVYFDGQEKDRFQTFVGALNLTYMKSKASSFSFGLAAFLTDELVSYDISGEYWLDQAGTGGDDAVGGELGVGKYMEHARNRLRASVIQAQLRGASRIKNNNITYGLSWQHESFRDRSKEWEWRDSAGYSLPTQPEGVHLIYNLSSRQDMQANRLAIFAEDAFYFETSKAYITLNAGVRLSYWDFNKEFLFSPRANVSISPLNNNRLTYRAALGLYYQSPFYKEYRHTVTDELGNGMVELNRNIKSPRSLHFILGVDFTFRALNRPFKLTGEAYYKALSRLISYEYDNLKVDYSGVNDSKGHIAGLDMKLFGQFVEGSDSWISFSLMNTSQTLGGVKTPLPSDQRYALSLFFTDYFPKFPKLKFSLRGIFSDGLTMTAPHVSRDINYFRAPAYKRVDIGFSYQLVGAPKDGVRPYNFWRHFKDISIALDVFNLLDIANVSGYYWVTDVNNIKYAVPNYLTRRQFNVRLSFEL
ncbi:MAG: TonB-dependent receptor [Bacteroidales bacterium]|nr:TonB-dependent receptor [Bacteroidales bacterium]